METLSGFADNSEIVDTQRGQINRKNGTLESDEHAYLLGGIRILDISRIRETNLRDQDSQWAI